MSPCSSGCNPVFSSPTLIHSSTNLTSILKDSNLSVLPHQHSSPLHFPAAVAAADYAMYGGSKTGMLPPSSSSASSGSPRHHDDVSWAILPTYTNGAFRQSADTLVDSGFYRAGEAVDNVSEFYRPAATAGGGSTVVDYVTYQNLGLKSTTLTRALPALADDDDAGPVRTTASSSASMMMMMAAAARGDVSDNGTGTTSSTDCEHSETCSDKNLPPSFGRHGGGGGGHLDTASRAATAEFHSLIVTGEGWGLRGGGGGGEGEEAAQLSVSGPLSLPAYDLEKRRRRESFV